MSRHTAHREINAVAEIDCPRCGAPRGVPCKGPMTPVHGPACCAERRSTNQERRRTTIEKETQETTK